MSINVTVNGNPICVRRSRMVLSDLEQIKKNERDRKRRLRLEQVRQQSKEISCKLLERAKNLAKQELNRLDRDAKSELRKMHERKIMEIQRKYQEDMEDIGLAHSAAARQPDVEAIIEADDRKNRMTAAERGKEATQRLKEIAQREDAATIQQERLRQVREVENVRSAMVAKLPSKSAARDVERSAESSDIDEIVVDRTIRQTSPKKKIYKKLVGKKSPSKVVSKSNVKVVAQQQKSKSPRHVAVEVHRADSKSPKRPASRARKGVAENPNKTSVCKTASVATEVECANSRCNGDANDQEPRKTVPTMKLTPTKADKVARYNPDDYKQKTSDTNGSSSSSVSNDSSYFSDGCGDLILPKKTPKHHPSPVKGNTVQLYDHSTRQRNSYNQPVGLVERMNIRNEPNAEDAARELLKSESIASNILDNRRMTAQKRGSDAILRDRVRRDYETMMKNLDHLTREERKLEVSKPPPSSSRCCANDHATSQSRRTERQNDRRRNMDRAFENILRETKQPVTLRTDDLVERIITIPPRVERRSANNFPEATWQIPPFFDDPTARDDPRRENDDDADEMSREEHILEMLKKVERQKRLLLREFGADLPNTIFSASMTPLFDGRPSDGQDRPAVPLPPPAPPPTVAQSVSTPEIKIINMSSTDEIVEKSKIVKKKSAKKMKSPPPPPPPPPLTTIETAVQTSRLDEIGASEDKSTQVEISPDVRSKFEIPINRNVDNSVPGTYVEPRVTVVAPAANDTSTASSSGGSSRITGIIIEVDEKRVKVTPKKKKIGSDRSSKRGTSRNRSKPRSLPASVAGSPVKRTPTSAPSSRAGSPKKIDAGSAAGSRSPTKIPDPRANQNAVKIHAGTSRRCRIVEDSTIESSPPHSTPEIRDDYASKPYRIFKQPTFKKIRETRDASDTSTSYASLPAATPATVQSARNGVTPILELLDSSANESARIGRRNVSPVSTPETPSPRIMNVPSNIPHPERIGRILRFESFSETAQLEDSTLPSSTLHEQSTSTDRSYFRNAERSSTRDPRAIADRRSDDRSSIGRGFCSCANPNCVLVHENVVDIRDFAHGTDNPEVMKKYEDLQNVCTERIASLTELIRRVRNEQSGIEFSVTNPADETSLMQLPPPRVPRSDLQSVQKLVESIEAIHCQLAKTLQASQRIITSNAAPPSRTADNADVPASSTSGETKSKGSTSASTSTDDTPVVDGLARTAKPRVVSNVPVQIDLDKLNQSRGPYTAMVVTTDNVGGWPAQMNSLGHEEIVEKLYREILEQSMNVDGFREKTFANGYVERSLNGRRTPSPPQNLSAAHGRAQSSPRDKNDDEVTRDVLKEAEPENCSLVPVLAGLPKIPRYLPPGVPLGLRPRPPPASGTYRNEMGSPRRELSTIVEFDTPDTGNRSQTSAKSPTVKSRRNNEFPSPVKSTTSGSSPTEKNADTQTTTTKALVHGAPPTSQNPSRTIPRRLNMRDAAPLPEQKFVCQSPVDRASSNEKTCKSLLSQGPNAALDAATSGHENVGKTRDRSINGKSGKNGDNSEDRNETLDENVCPPASSTLNPDCDNKNDKVTSTSSNSFSGVSGISEIMSTPTSEIVKWASSSEGIESALKKMGLGWAIVTLKKTREASALSSSSNSDVTPMNTARRTKSPGKRLSNESNPCGLLDFSDVSSISIKEASKSTERAVLMKARTSTPNVQISNSSSEKSSSATTSSSGISLQDNSDSLTAPNISLTNNR